jgi:vitamin B12 transporter
MNVSRARVRGVEASLEATWLTVQWRGRLTWQRPRDEDTGKRLQNRAEHFGALEASRAFGPLTATAAVVASGERFDSIGELAESRLAPYSSVDLRLRYRFPRHWSVDLAATNLADRAYETARGYDAPRRAVLLTVRFDAF